MSRQSVGTKKIKIGISWVNSMRLTNLSHLDLEKLIIPCLILFVVIGFNATTLE